MTASNPSTDRGDTSHVLNRAANQLPISVLVAVGLVFAWLAPEFATRTNAVNLLAQAASGAILAGGMSLVMMSGGIDLSVGSLMFFLATIAGKMMVQQWTTPWIVLSMIIVGVAVGGVHGWLITRCRLTPFIVTMASLFVLRGAGLWISQTRAMTMSAHFTSWSTARWLGIPVVVWVAAASLGLISHLHRRTAWGRQIMAIGYHASEAYKAGIDVVSVRLRVYAASGACAALAAFVSLTQLGAVSPTFGRDREFDAIAAAVLGGTSLLGGKGNVLPGAAVGALLVSAVFNGLNLMNANPYVYPLVTGLVILFAIALDVQVHRRRASSMALLPNH